jgi:hypothetical protein
MARKKITLKEALPHVIPVEKNFKDLPKSRKLKKFDMKELVTRVGETALHYLLFLKEDSGDCSPGTATPAEKAYHQEKLWDILFETIYDYKLDCLQPRVRLSVPELKRRMKIVKMQISRMYEPVGVHGTEIKTSDIHKAKGVDLRKAIPITCPDTKTVKPKRAK